MTLGFRASRTPRQISVVYKPPRLWQFIYSSLSGLRETLTIKYIKLQRGTKGLTHSQRPLILSQAPGVGSLPTVPTVSSGSLPAAEMPGTVPASPTRQ